jgi:ribose/xylose/arabinose/galactoside ABC-type transport system permease subunit
MSDDRRVPQQRSAASTALAIVLNVAAIALLAVGLLAPLTPSEGMPSIGALVVFAAGPSALLLAAFLCRTPKPVRLLIGVECALVLVLLLALLKGLFETCL